jgi:hypothetical protein
MKISELKKHLLTVEEVNFELKDGNKVPSHFHVTEMGIVTKHFMDCGGVVRNEKVASLQLWDSSDFEHRLSPGKLLKIMSKTEAMLGMEDLDIEVEYQSGTVGKYGLDFNGTSAKGKMPDLIEVEGKGDCCVPGGGCC